MFGGWRHATERSSYPTMTDAVCHKSTVTQAHNSRMLVQDICEAEGGEVAYLGRRARTLSEPRAPSSVHLWLAHPRCLVRRVRAGTSRWRRDRRP